MNCASDENHRRLRPLDWARAEGAEDIVEKAMVAGVQRRKRVRMIRACTAASVLLAISSVVWLRDTNAQRTLHSTKTSFVASPATRTLTDGSIVQLNSEAVIRVDFSGSVRRVFLDRGEAHFQVAKNADWPFVVMARGVEVKAVGTAFLVQLQADKIDVVVTEGRVAVGRGAEAPSSVHVDAGQALIVHSASQHAAVEPVTALDPNELARRLAWRIPMLELDLTPLGEVVPIVVEHAGNKISFADASMAKLRLTGRLRANNVSVLLQILESSYGIRAVTSPAGEIVLHRSP